MKAIGTLTGLIGLLFVTATSAQAQQVAVASITGPIAVTKESGEPYRGANEQPVAGPGLPLPVLVPYGYVEEEYFVSGTVDGKPYKTSLLVRKPKDAAKFSGLVAVETIHAQGAIPFWGQREVWLNGGHGWAMVASQLVSLEQHVKKANAKRYESLQIPTATGSGGGNPLAGGAQGRISQEILSQVGAMLKANLPNGPFAGLNVRYLLQGGSSQTGGTTLAYIAESHPKARLPNGRPIYDGYLPMEAFTPTPVPATDVPVVHPVGEGDFGLFRGMMRGPGAFGYRPDSDAPNDKYRRYEIVASSHVPTRGISDPKVIFPTLADAMKPGDQLSQFPSAPIYKILTTHLVNWVMNGTAPPHAKPLEMKDGEFVRDEFGNAKGGVRSAYVDLPTASYTASAPADGNMARAMIGLQKPIPASQLKKMYQSRANYLALFDANIDKMVAERFLLPEDAKVLKDEEKKNAPQF